MKRVVLLSSTVAILVGAGLAAVIGKIALDHNPQDELRACIKTVIGRPSNATTPVNGSAFS